MTDIDHLDPDLDDLGDDDEAPTLLDRAAIMQAATAATVRTEDVHVPELGGWVRVREMPGGMRNRIEAAMIQIRSGGDSKMLDRAQVQLLAVCVVDAGNQPILKEADARRLFARHARAALRLREEIFGVSAFDDGDAEALAEGFGDGQSDSSTSG